MDKTKFDFLKNDFLLLVEKIDVNEKPRWGLMNAQQMIEHFSETLRYANGKTNLPLVTDINYLPKLLQFMLSEKPFRENTKSPMLNEMPPPIKKEDFKAAKEELKNELEYFFLLFENNPGAVTQNPVFGPLTFDENVHLLHKHALHHLKQFGAI